MAKSIEGTKEKKVTALGEIYNSAQPWQRTKILNEVLNGLGVSRSSLRAYMISTPAYRMRADMKAIILSTLPEAEDCFVDPRVNPEVIQ
jgi:hypothetical protein